MTCELKWRVKLMLPGSFSKASWGRGIWAGLLVRQNFARKSQSRKDHISGHENRMLKVIEAGNSDGVWGECYVVWRNCRNGQGPGHWPLPLCGCGLPIPFSWPPSRPFQMSLLSTLSTASTPEDVSALSSVFSWHLEFTFTTALVHLNFNFSGGWSRARGHWYAESCSFSL